MDNIGQRGQDTRELFFSDMRVPTTSMLGDSEGLGVLSADGTAAAQSADHFSLCAVLIKSAVLEAVRYAKQREVFGHTLIKFQHKRFELTQFKAKTLSIKTTFNYSIRQYIGSHNNPATSSMAKLIAAR